MSQKGGKKKKKKTTPFGVNIMRSQVLCWAAQVLMSRDMCRAERRNAWRFVCSKLTLQDPAAVVQATLGVLEQVKLLLLPDISQLLELSLNGQLFDGRIGDFRDVWAILVQSHGKHVAQCECLGVHVELLACSTQSVSAH